MHYETILLVDDEDQVRDVLSGVLENNGYRVLQAGNYYEALRAAASVRIDFLIADVSLPGPNGCELAVQLLRSEPELQVLFISGYTGAEVCSTYGVSLSDSHFLAKPFEPPALVARVDELLQERPEERITSRLHSHQRI